MGIFIIPYSLNLTRQNLKSIKKSILPCVTVFKISSDCTASLICSVENSSNNCKCFLLTSLWEDPGFVLVEAGIANATVISSNCPNGPEEILENM